MTAVLVDAVIELRRQEPNPEAVARAVLGDLSTDEQREAAYAAFEQFVRFTCESMRQRAYSVAAVAQILDVPDKQVYKLVEDGVVGHFLVGRHIRVPESELDRLMAVAA